MERSKQNPYMELGLVDLVKACHERGRELFAGGTQRTPAQRAALAESTGFLLMALARAIDPGEHVTDTPRRELDGRIEGMADAFARHHEREVRALRYRTLAQAADYAYGGDGWPWLRGLHLGGQELADVAQKNERELLLALHLLEAKSPRRQKYPA